MGSLEYNILTDHGLIYLRLNGQISVQDFSKCAVSIYKNDSRYRAGMKWLVDCQLIQLPEQKTPKNETELTLLLDDVEKLKQSQRPLTIAAVTSDPLLFGILRMWDTLLITDLVQFHIANSVQQGLAAIDLPNIKLSELRIDDSFDRNL